MIRARKRTTAGITLNFLPGMVNALIALVLSGLFIVVFFFMEEIYSEGGINSRGTFAQQLMPQFNILQGTVEEKDQIIQSLRQEKQQLKKNYKKLEREVILSTKIPSIKSKLEGFISEASIFKQAKLQDSIQMQENEALEGKLHKANEKILQLEDVLSLLHSESELEQLAKMRTEKEAYTLKEKLFILKNKFQQIVATLKEKEAVLTTKNFDLTSDLIIETELSKEAKPTTQFSLDLFLKLRRFFDLRRGFLMVEDRFIIESKNIFVKDTAKLTLQGKKYLVKYLTALKEVIKSIPANYRWVLRIDSHTDARPFSSKKYPSNLHLSSDRAVAVMQFLEQKGIEGKNLAAVGFGAYQPIKKEYSMIAHRKNNRIELKLDQL